jgi:hypothetical protein
MSRELFSSAPTVTRAWCHDNEAGPGLGEQLAERHRVQCAHQLHGDGEEQHVVCSPAVGELPGVYPLRQARYALGDNVQDAALGDGVTVPWGAGGDTAGDIHGDECLTVAGFAAEPGQ